MSFAIIAVFSDRAGTRPIDPAALVWRKSTRVYYAKLDDHVPGPAAIARAAQLRRPLGHLPGHKHIAALDLDSASDPRLTCIGWKEFP